MEGEKKREETTTGGEKAAGTTPRLVVEAHKAYIQRLSGKRDGFEHWVSEHLKMSGLYWGLCALDMLDALPASGAAAAPPPEGQTTTEGPPTREELVKWVLACQCENGGFGGSVGHDPHLLYTLSAVQVTRVPCV